MNDRSTPTDRLAEQLAAKIEAELYATICGGQRQPSATALRVRGGTFETVQLDAGGNVIERCPKCGPLLLCAEHMAMVT